jgi:hypothetical protein
VNREIVSEGSSLCQAMAHHAKQRLEPSLTPKKKRAGNVGALLNLDNFTFVRVYPTIR